MPLSVPPLLYLLAPRCGSDSADAGAAGVQLPVWALVAAAVFLAGFRIGLNLETPRG